MKKFSLLTVFICLLTTTAFCDEVISEFSDQTLPVLNEELRRSGEDIRSLETRVTTLESASSVSAGMSVQTVNVQVGSVATGTTVLPDDDSIPQSNEGDQYMTLAITPTSATNKLLIQAVVYGYCTGGNIIAAALFQDTTANALSAGRNAPYAGAPYCGPIVLTYYMTSGTTSATTFKVRAGGVAGTFTFNGEAGGRKYGGVMSSSITITEIQV